MACRIGHNVVEKSEEVCSDDDDGSETSDAYDTSDTDSSTCSPDAATVETPPSSSVAARKGRRSGALSAPVRFGSGHGSSSTRRRVICSKQILSPITEEEEEETADGETIAARATLRSQRSRWLQRIRQSVRAVAAPPKPVSLLASGRGAARICRRYGEYGYDTSADSEAANAPSELQLTSK